MFPTNRELKKKKKKKKKTRSNPHTEKEKPPAPPGKKQTATFSKTDTEKGGIQKENIWKVYSGWEFLIPPLLCVLLFDGQDSISSLLWKI